MNNTKNRNSEVRWRLRSAVLLALVAGLGFASCGKIVDSEDENAEHSTAPEANVKNYYYKIEDKGAQYRYALTSKNAYLPMSDVLVMNMQGKDDYDTEDGLPVCICDWTYEKTNGVEPWYYGVSESKIVDFGVDVGGSYTDSWVDLQAPLKQGASWEFDSHKEHIVATVSKYRVSAAVGGKTFDDVIVVDYKGTTGTLGTTWFQRDMGVVYSHITRPGDVLVDLQFKSMQN